MPGTVAAGAIVLIATAYLLWLDALLAATQSLALGWRVAVAAGAIAPLGVAMGHLFPLGLRRVSTHAPELVSWCWAVNGVASVIAAVGAPLAAMQIGFARLTVAAVVLYALAGAAMRWLPGARRSPVAKG